MIKIKKTIIIAIILMIALVTTISASVNISILNNSFETGLINWTTYGSHAITIDNTLSSEGTNSIKIYDETIEDNSISGITQEIFMLPNEKYLLTFDYLLTQLTSSSFIVYINYYDENDVYISDDFLPVTQENVTFQEIQFENITPLGTTKMKIEMYINRGTSGVIELNIDNFNLEYPDMQDISETDLILINRVEIIIYILLFMSTIYLYSIFSKGANK